MLFQCFQEQVLCLALSSSKEERESVKTGVCVIGLIFQLNQFFPLWKVNKTFKLRRILNTGPVLLRKQILAVYNVFMWLSGNKWGLHWSSLIPNSLLLLFKQSLNYSILKWEWERWSCTKQDIIVWKYSNGEDLKKVVKINVHEAHLLWYLTLQVDRSSKIREDLVDCWIEISFRKARSKVWVLREDLKQTKLNGELETDAHVHIMWVLNAQLSLEIW